MNIKLYSARFCDRKRDEKDKIEAIFQKYFFIPEKDFSFLICNYGIKAYIKRIQDTGHSAVGSVLALGARSRGFESRCPDHFFALITRQKKHEA